MRAVLFPAPTEIVPGSTAFMMMHHAKVQDIDPNLACDLVGGDFEILTMPLNHSGYISMDAKTLGLPVNPDADSLWKRAFQTLPGDYIAGPCVVLGPPNSAGEDTPVTDEFLALLKTLAIQVDQS